MKRADLAAWGGEDWDRGWGRDGGGGRSSGSGRPRGRHGVGVSRACRAGRGRCCGAVAGRLAIRAALCSCGDGQCLEVGLCGDKGGLVRGCLAGGRVVGGGFHCSR